VWGFNRPKYFYFQILKKIRKKNKQIYSQLIKLFFAVVIATWVIKATTLIMDDLVVEVKANKRGRPKLAE